MWKNLEILEGGIITYRETVIIVYIWKKCSLIDLAFYTQNVHFSQTCQLRHLLDIWLDVYFCICRQILNSTYINTTYQSAMQKNIFYQKLFPLSFLNKLRWQLFHWPFSNEATLYIIQNAWLSVSNVKVDFIGCYLR